MHEEYEVFCRQYYDRIYRFLLKLCGERELAEDLTQETFYRAFLSLHRFKGESDPFTYVAAIAKHTYFKHIRKNKRRSMDISLGDMADYIEDTEQSDPLYMCEKASEALAVRNAVDRLPDKYKDVVLYRVYAGMSFAQTAAALNITENSAKVIFYRAKKKLTEELENGINMQHGA